MVTMGRIIKKKIGEVQEAENVKEIAGSRGCVLCQFLRSLLSVDCFYI